MRSWFILVGVHIARASLWSLRKQRNYTIFNGRMWSTVFHWESCCRVNILILLRLSRFEGPTWNHDPHIESSKGHFVELFCIESASCSIHRLLSDGKLAVGGGAGHCDPAIPPINITFKQDLTRVPRFPSHFLLLRFLPSTDKIQHSKLLNALKETQSTRIKKSLNLN